MSPLLYAGLLLAAGAALGAAQAGDRGAPAATVGKAGLAPAVAAGFDRLPANCGNANFEARIVDLLNRVRAVGANCGAAGLYGPASPLRWNHRLADVARSHTAEMAMTDHFQHAGLRDGRSVAQRIDASGDAWGEFGENIAAGGLSPEEIIARWHRSPRHCVNLMNPHFTDVGAACMPANQPSRYLTYWTMDLAGP